MKIMNLRNVFIFVILTSFSFKEETVAYVARTSLRQLSKWQSVVRFQQSESGASVILTGQLSQSLESRSLSCLDLMQVLTAMKTHVVTNYARDLISDFVASKSYSCSILRTHKQEEANVRYRIVSDISKILGYFPLQRDITSYFLSVLAMIERNTSPGPERPELAGFSFDLDGIYDLHTFLEQNIQTGSLEKELFDTFSEALSLPTELIETFKDSFELSTNAVIDSGSSTDLSSRSSSFDEMILNAKKYPVLKQLRSRAATLKAGILQTLNSLLQSPEMREKIADQ